MMNPKWKGVALAIGLIGIGYAVFTYNSMRNQHIDAIEGVVHTPRSAWPGSKIKTHCFGSIQYFTVTGGLSLSLTEQRNPDGELIHCETLPHTGEFRLYQVCVNGILHYSLRGMKELATAVAFDLNDSPKPCSDGQVDENNK